MAQLDVEGLPESLSVMRRGQMSQDSQIVLQNVQHRFPRFESFSDKGIIVLIKAKPLQDWSNVCHSIDHFIELSHRSTERQKPRAVVRMGVGFSCPCSRERTRRKVYRDGQVDATWLGAHLRQMR